MSVNPSRSLEADESFIHQPDRFSEEMGMEVRSYVSLRLVAVLKP